MRETPQLLTLASLRSWASLLVTFPPFAADSWPQGSWLSWHCLGRPSLGSPQGCPPSIQDSAQMPLPPAPLTEHLALTPPTWCPQPGDGHLHICLFPVAPGSALQVNAGCVLPSALCSLWNCAQRSAGTPCLGTELSCPQGTGSWRDSWEDCRKSRWAERTRGQSAATRRDGAGPQRRCGWLPPRRQPSSYFCGLASLMG